MSKRTNSGTDGSTDRNPGPADGTGDVPPLDAKSQQILAALTELGEATAAALATHLGIGYSTTTPKLRNLNDHGLAEPTKAGNGQTVWRLTDAGGARLATISRDNGTADHTPASTDAGSDAGSDVGEDTTAQDAPAVTEPAVDTDPPTEHDIANSASSTPGNAVEAVAVEHDAAHDAGTDDGATADETGAVDVGELAAATASEPPAGGADDGAATLADPASETPVPDTDVDRGDTDGEDPADGAGTADQAPDQAPAEAAHDNAADSTVPASASEEDATTGNAAAAAPVAAPTGDTATGKVRRPNGSLDKAVLTILRARPEAVLKTGELCKLINKAEEGTGMPPASPGAVVLAAQRLVARQQAILAVEKPASFQLMPGAVDHAVSAARPDTADTQPGQNRPRPQTR